MSMLKTALTYTANGISIIPSHPKTKRPFWQRLPKIDHPTKPGKKKATWKPYQQKIAAPVTIRYWFRDNYLNITVVCGQVSGGLVVFDFDHQAKAMFSLWRETVGRPLCRRLVIARSGKGYHVYLRLKGKPVPTRKVAFNEDGELLIEVKAEGGLVQAPPSLHPSGCRYRWLQGTQAHIPLLTKSAFSRLLEAAESLDKRPAQPSFTQAEIDTWRVVQLPQIDGQHTQYRLNRYTEAAVANECAQLAHALKGQRNDALNLAAFRLGRFVSAGLLTSDQVYQALLKACEANHYLQDDGLGAFQRTFRSGLLNGAKQGEILLKNVYLRTKAEAEIKKGN
ncbi:MAG: bifunctional DNA primase/polymerase [Chloroflexi bacterium]|nr:bifunctional DNA primase/polymerase [Chloroflexota bacterium]